MSDYTYAQEQEAADALLESQIADHMERQWMIKLGNPVEWDCGCVNEVEHGQGWCEQ